MGTSINMPVTGYVGSDPQVRQVGADRFGRNNTEAMRAIDELDEFGVAVRFANMPDIDPMDMDPRVLVTITFTLARRESALLGVRVKGGLQAKRKIGGFTNLAPDCYLNMSGRIGSHSNIILPVKPFNSSIICHFLNANHSRHS